MNQTNTKADSGQPKAAQARSESSENSTGFASTRKQAVIDPKTGETKFFNARSILDRATSDQKTELAKQREAARKKLLAESTPNDGTKKPGSQTTK